MRNAEPAYFVRGSGCRVQDDQGQSYLDFRNALGPLTLGYAHPKVQEAIAKQLQDGILYSGPHPLELELAELLVQMIPAAEQVRYLKTGGEAMAAAIKLARAHTGKDLILSSGYHGWLQTVHNQPGVPRAVAELTLAYNYGDLDTLRRLLETHQGQVAAVTISADYVRMVPGDTFPRELAALAKQYGALLIVDEIVTGFRLAHGGWSQYYGVTPDLAVFSKGIANGMPISVYLGKREVMQQAANGAVVSSTFSGETLSLAAAKAVLEIYRDEPVIEHLWARGEQLGDGLRKIFAQHDLPIELSGLPPCPRMIFAGGDPAVAGPLRQALFSQAASQGVLLFDVPYVNYAHSEADIDDALGRIEKACTQIDLAVLPQQTASTSPRIGASA